MKTSGSRLYQSASTRTRTLIRPPLIKLIIFFLIPVTISAQTTIVYQETVGNYPGSIGVLIYTGWTTPGAMHGSSGAVSVTNSLPSSNYPGASGGTPIKIAAGGTWTISNINTALSTYIKLSFGMHKSNKNETGSGLIIEVSNNGTTYTPLTTTSLPTGNGTGNSWFYRTGGVDITGSIPAASNLRIRFRNTGAADYGLDDIELTSTIALPLTLLDFSGQRNNDRTELSWTTTNEENVSHFEVQRSENGMSFSTVQSMKARNSGRTEIYNAIDNGIGGKAYYRLASVDNDFKTTYSKVISLSAKTSAELFLLSSRSSKAELVLVGAGSVKGDYQYVIVSMTGQILQKGIHTMNNGSNTIPLNPNINNGVYIVSISNGSFHQKVKAMF